MAGDSSPLGSGSKGGRELRSCSGTSGERLDRSGFVFLDIEHAVQFGGFQQIEDVGLSKIFFWPFLVNSRMVSLSTRPLPGPKASASPRLKRPFRSRIATSLDCRTLVFSDIVQVLI